MVVLTPVLCLSCAGCGILGDNLHINNHELESNDLYSQSIGSSAASKEESLSTGSIYVTEQADKLRHASKGSE